MTTQKGAVHGSAAPARSWATPGVSAAELIRKVLSSVAGFLDDKYLKFMR